jgi:hypothetical protein
MNCWDVVRELRSRDLVIERRESDEIMRGGFVRIPSPTKASMKRKLQCVVI